MDAVVAVERRLGFDPKDVSALKCGYDVESRIRAEGRLRFIEVKEPVAGATMVTVTKNEILMAFNQPEMFSLAIVEVDGDRAGEPQYVQRPFQKEPDFGATSVTYKLADLLVRGEAPA